MLWFSPFGLPAQDAYVHGLLPALNLNTGLSPRYSLNLKLESRQALRAGFFSETPLSRYEYVLTDLSLIASREVGLRNKVALGYLARFRQGRVVHRTIQQLAFIQFFNTFRLGHRLRFDQTFRPEQAVELRLRYRLTIELPLQGQAVDPREFYLKGNNEYLASFQEGTSDLEIRLAPFLGYVFSDANKLECGLDYRFADLIRYGSRHSFWWSISWYLKL